MTQLAPVDSDKKRTSLLVCFVVVAALQTTVAQAEGPIAIADVAHDGPVNFEKEVLPILRKNCLACHSSSTAESSLVLEDPASILKGGDSGAAAVVNNGAESYLLRVASHQEEPVMPPEDNKVGAKALTPEELGLIKLWIDQGATGDVDAESEIQWQALPAGINPIYAVSVSPDGQFAACGRANQIFLYHLPTARLLGRLSDPAAAAMIPGALPGVAHLDLVQSLAFSPRGDLMASGSYREVKLWRKSPNVHQSQMTGLAAAAQAIAVSADSKFTAIGDATGTIKLFDLASGQEVRSITGHTGAITGLSFSADGSKLVSGAHDQSLRVWNVSDGTILRQVATPSVVNAVALSADSSMIVSGDADGVVRVWAVESPAAEPAMPLKELRGHNGPVTALSAFPQDGKQFVSGGTDGSIRQWNLENGQQIREMNHGAAVTSVSVRADGKRFASGSSNNVVKLWNPENGQVVAELKGDFRSARQVMQLERQVNLGKVRVEDAKKSVTEAEARVVQESDVLKKAQEAKTAAEKALAEKAEALKKPQADADAAAQQLQAADAALKDAQTKLAAAKAASEADTANADLKKAFELATQAAADADQKTKQSQQLVEQNKAPLMKAQAEVTAAEAGVATAVRAVQAAEESVKRAQDAVPVAQSVVTAAESSQKQLETNLDAARQAAIATEKPIRAVVFSRDGLRLAVGGEQGIVTTYTSEAGTPLEVFEPQQGAVSSLAFADDNRLIVGSENRVATTWNVEPQWTLERTIGNANDPTMLVDRVIGLAFSPNGEVLATGSGEPSRSGELKLWNSADGSLLRSIPDAHSDTIYSLSFSPDSTYLASSGADRFVKVWNVSDGAFVRSFEGHTHHVLGVAWKSDQKILASAGADSVVKVWNFQTGEQIRTIAGMSKEVTAIQFVADTPRTVSSVGDRTVRLLNVESGGNERNYGGATDYLFASAITPDGKLVLAGGQDSVLRVWNVEDGQQIHNFEAPK